MALANRPYNFTLSIDSPDAAGILEAFDQIRAELVKGKYEGYYFVCQAARVSWEFRQPDLKPNGHAKGRASSEAQINVHNLPRGQMSAEGTLVRDALVETMQTASVVSEDPFA
jgi:hypothetical protein